jgi:chemotaxis signal transduction protein
VDESPQQPAPSLIREPAPGKYLTFRIGRHEFAMDATCVRGMLPAHEVVTQDQQLPGDSEPQEIRPKRDSDEDWIAGQAIFQGAELQVVDLRAKLRLRRGIPGRNPCIVVVDAGCSGLPNLTGFLVDGVGDIVTARARDFSQGRLRIGRPRQVLEVGVVLDETRELEVLAS